mgnify:CR=1 FL=1
MQKMIFAFITAAAAVMLISPLFIPMLRRLKYGQVERAEGPHAHSAKEGTPTMGGIMFIIAIIIAVAAFSIYGIAFDFSVLAVLIMLAFGLVGFLDDFIKVKRKRNLGLRAYQKIIAQLLLSFAAAYYAYKSSFIGSTLYDPIFGSIELGGWYIPFTMFMIIAVVNSANLTDGLDGLLSGVRTLTANIVLEMGYASGLHREALISTAVVLFVFILIINLSFMALKRRVDR